MYPKIRFDKYQVGDKIEIDPTFHAYDVVENNYKLGRKYTVLAIVNNVHGKSLRSVGHTQHIKTELSGSISGAFFKPVREEE